MDEQREEHRVLSGAQQGHVRIRTLEDFFVLDTTSCARILRGEVDMQTHCRVLISLLSSSSILDVRFGNFEEDKCFKKVVENFNGEKTWGFVDSMDPNVQREHALHALFREFTVVVANC